MNKRTYVAKPKDIQRNWYLVDAQGQVLGRFAAKIANILRGKNRAIFTPHMDTGHFVVVINAEKIKVTGAKLKDKTYSRYSGYPDGRKVFTLETMLKKKPEFVIKHAVEGMVPRTRLGKDIMSKLKVYKGPEHPHKAQNPTAIKI